MIPNLYPRMNYDMPLAQFCHQVSFIKCVNITEGILGLELPIPYLPSFQGVQNHNAMLCYITGEESPDPTELETMVSQGYKIAVFPKPAFVVTGIKIINLY